MDKAERNALRKRCKPLGGDHRPTPAEMLARAARWCATNEVDWDVYGGGDVVEQLERRVASLLGYPSARFMPSGTMAQLIAMRIWCDRAGVSTFGMHPTSHVELHEERAYAHLHDLEARLVGPRERPLLAAHLEAVPERLGALLTELPAREIGGQLPSWDELSALKEAAATRGVPLHLDGARLWSCGPAYDRAYSEITQGFASCYVSFYKGIGALSGAMLLGTEDFVAEAKMWQRRMGGNLFTLLPNVVTAAMFLEDAIEGMATRLEGARALVAALSGIPGCRPYPDPPHTHLFHVALDLEGEAAIEARDRVARDHGIWLFGGLREGHAPGTSRLEITVGNATLDLDPKDVRSAFETLLAAR